ncbi:MAG: class I SAM-dependent methyltransferase [Iphinoe sp. HA4291-MV1]|jgi:SAM-dependent methyltransferase|nr:class I SAM-dependent methyltransferase [Iphinoe sp. HA4291-MV1]
MQKNYVASAFLTIKDSQVLVVHDWKNQKKIQVIENKDWLTILEIFVHEQSVKAAYEQFQKIQVFPVLESVQQQCIKARSNSDDFMVFVAHKVLKVLKKGVFSLLTPEEQVDLTANSQETYQVMRYLFEQGTFTDKHQDIKSFDAFSQSVEDMAKLGLLSPSIDTLDLGDLRRRFPICPLFGFTRGTPIDRYYLDKFIGEIREQVAGNVLEVGGVLRNREVYQFYNATEYQTLDIFASSGVTLVGDVHDPETIRPESLDAVVIFNVLEHCHNPWVVVKNIYSWLKVGGQCFCMVPSAQKLHDVPGDYWRPLPDGMKQLFQDFSQQKLHVYGNPLTVVASFMGISAEELSLQELDDFHPDYPVATCMIAMK